MPFLVVQPTVSQQRTDTTGILLSDSYFVIPISIFNISPSLSSQLPLHWLLLEQYMFILIVVAMRFVIDFIKPILCYVYVTTFCEEE